MLLAKFAVDVGEFFKPEYVVVVEIVHVDALAVGTAEGKGGLYYFNALFCGGVFD